MGRYVVTTRGEGSASMVVTDSITGKEISALEISKLINGEQLPNNCPIENSISATYLFPPVDDKEAFERSRKSTIKKIVDIIKQHAFMDDSDVNEFSDYFNDVCSRVVDGSAPSSGKFNDFIPLICTSYLVGKKLRMIEKEKS